MSPSMVTSASPQRFMVTLTSSTSHELVRSMQDVRRRHAPIDMSLDAHPGRSPERQNERPSTFAAILHRIGLIRENSNWHRPRPLSTIARRRGRILTARKSIDERLTAYISALRSPQPQPGKRRLWITVLLFVVLIVAVLAVLL